MKIIYHVFITFLLSSIGCFAQDCNSAIHNGEGTFYGGVAGGEGGNCSLPVPSGDFLHCALNTIDYDNSNACGACIEVTGPNGVVTLKVVDRCPECLVGDVDLTQQAFAQIANIEDGRVPISWKYVPCELESTNIKINFKEGSSEFWTAIQLRDIEHAVISLEYEDDGGTWITIQRELYNFFVAPDGIMSPLKLRATPIIGEPLVFENIVIDVDNDYDTGQQFMTPQECMDPLSIPAFELQKGLYPNPTNGPLFLPENTKNWSVFNFAGKKLEQGNSSYVDLSLYANGIYFILLDSQRRFVKIIKK